MSLKTWMDEFYPTPAESCPEEQALQHSRLKWTGLLPENLDKHGLVADKQGDLVRRSCEGEGCFIIDSRSCALCHFYYGSAKEEYRCVQCPLSWAKGGPCDAGHRSPYVAWKKDHDPQPMLELIAKAMSLKNHAG